MTDYQSLTNDELISAILQAEGEVEVTTRQLRQGREELMHRKRNEVAAAYSDKGSQFGVIHLEEAGYDLEINTTPKVDWDQGILADLEWQIREEWKSDPSEYIERKFTVKEAKYKAWPSELKAKFEPARTVKASIPSLSITSKK